MADTARWYVVHTYSGYENTVKATIEKTVESRGLHDQILAISIPLETVTEITESGVSKTYDRKVFPGYVLVIGVFIWAFDYVANIGINALLSLKPGS